MKQIKSFIKSVGGYLPEKIISNDDLSQLVETSDEWIYTRTGISSRHIAEENELTSDMCVAAANSAIKNANINKDNIDLIIVATTTPDKTFPATAAITQAKLGIKNNAPAFDIQAVCSGFVYALSIADSMIKTGHYKNALVIGADKMSSIIDWKDRSTCVLFGDGAGAVILSDNEVAPGSEITSFSLKTDGNLEEILYTDGGIASTGNSGKVIMNGREVYRHAVEKMINSLDDLLQKHYLTSDDIAYIIPHQANARIISSIAKKLNLAENKVIMNLQHTANTSAATIPLALNAHQHKFNRGDYLMMTSAGGGFTWGSILLKW